MAQSTPPAPPALEIPAPTREKGMVVHRRETRLQIILPFVGALLIVIGLTALPVLINDPQYRLRVSFVGDLLLTLFVLCPAVVCMAALYFLVVLGIFGMSVVHRMAGTPLERLEQISARFGAGLDSVSKRVSDGAISLGSSLAPLYRLLSVFDHDPEA
jgi:hypothetical protein